MSSHDESLGALLIGTWANSFLYMLEIIQATSYFSYYPSDTCLIKALVGLLLIIDAISTLASYAGVYLYTITHWGDTVYLVHEYWPMGVYLVTTGLSAAIVQSFLIYRYWSLNPIISSSLGVLVIVAFGGDLGCAVLLLNFSDYAQRNHLINVGIMWLVSSATADICIALALIWQLRKVKTSFKSTKNLLHRLSISALQTGLAPSIVATLALITFLRDIDSNVCAAFGQCLGRVYACTMLFNLNGRRGNRELPLTVVDVSVVLDNTTLSLDTRTGDIHNHQHSDERKSYANPVLSSEHKMDLQLIDGGR